MLKSKGYTYFSQLVTVTIGTSGKKSYKITLPTEYNMITGIGVQIINASNQPNFKVSLANTNAILLQDVVHKLMKFDDSVPPAYKLLPTQFAYKDNIEHTLVVECVDGAVAGTDLNFDIVLKLDHVNNACSVNRKNRDFDPGSARPDEIIDYGTNS